MASLGLSLDADEHARWTAEQEAVYGAAVDDLLECWFRHHLIEREDDLLFRKALRMEPVVTGGRTGEQLELAV